MRKNFVRKVLFYSLPFYIFLSVFFFLIPTETHAETTETVITDGHSNGDVKRGERFFKGLLPFKRDYNSCVSCHNLIPTDTLNWNPSAMAIAVKYADKDFASFEAAAAKRGEDGSFTCELHDQGRRS